MSLPEPETCVSLASRATVCVRRKLEKKGGVFILLSSMCFFFTAVWYVKAGFYAWMFDCHTCVIRSASHCLCVCVCVRVCVFVCDCQLPVGSACCSRLQRSRREEGSLTPTFFFISKFYRTVWLSLSSQACQSDDVNIWADSTPLHSSVSTVNLENKTIMSLLYISE